MSSRSCFSNICSGLGRPMCMCVYGTCCLWRRRNSSPSSHVSSDRCGCLQRESASQALGKGVCVCVCVWHLDGMRRPISALSRISCSLRSCRSRRATSRSNLMMTAVACSTVPSLSNTGGGGDGASYASALGVILELELVEFLQGRTEHQLIGSSSGRGSGELHWRASGCICSCAHGSSACGAARAAARAPAAPLPTARARAAAAPAAASARPAPPLRQALHAPAQHEALGLGDNTGQAAATTCGSESLGKNLVMGTVFEAERL